MAGRNEVTVTDVVHEGRLASTLQSLRKSIRGASYDVLQSLICGQAGELDIPLCRMVPMTAVRCPLRSDVEKLKAEFVTGYRLGSACFYVSLKSLLFLTCGEARSTRRPSVVV